MTDLHTQAVIQSLTATRADLERLTVEVYLLRRAVELHHGDDIDAQTLAAIADVMGVTSVFSADDVIRYALRPAVTIAELELRAVLARSEALSPRRCGKVLARLEGRLLGGRVLTVAGEDRYGLIWRVSQPDSASFAGDICLETRVPPRETRASALRSEA